MQKLAAGLLWLLTSSGAWAAHSLVWSELSNEHAAYTHPAGKAVSISEQWQYGLVEAAGINARQPLDPQTLWSMPTSQFSPGELPSKLRLKGEERFVTRFSVESGKLNTDFLLAFEQPRLDVVHVSYRYPKEAWTTYSAGDRIAMKLWAQPDRRPTFRLHTQAGRMEVVVQIVHNGLIAPTAQLQDETAFLHDRVEHSWENGLLIGLAICLGSVAALMALHLRNLSFLSTTAMCLLAGAGLYVSSGMVGIFFGAGSDSFNDQLKNALHWVWIFQLPWLAALALSLQRHQRFCWHLTLAIALLGWVSASIFSDYDWREQYGQMTVPVITGLTLVSWLVLAWVWLRGINRQPLLMLGLAINVSVPALRLAAYVSNTTYVSIDFLSLYSVLLANLLVIRGLYLLHIGGRLVAQRAEVSPHRDVLTGLLNAVGLQRRLDELRRSMYKDFEGAAIVYIRLQDEHSALDELGEIGLEQGLVQIATSLSAATGSPERLARLSRSAFALLLPMPPDAAQATAVAQKVLTRLALLYSHGTPLASSARLALAWLPLQGLNLKAISKHCEATLAAMPASARIAWVGGVNSQHEASKMLVQLRQGHAVKMADIDHRIASAIRPPSGYLPREIRQKIEEIEQEMLNSSSNSLPSHGAAP